MNKWDDCDLTSKAKLKGEFRLPENRENLLSLLEYYENIRKYWKEEIDKKPKGYIFSEEHANYGNTSLSETYWQRDGRDTDLVTKNIQVTPVHLFLHARYMIGKIQKQLRKIKKQSGKAKSNKPKRK